MKIAIILGTRPEIIKMSPVIRECESRGLDYFVLHTGQHYSYNLDKIFFDELQLPQPRYNIDVGSGSHAEQTGKMMIGIENKIIQEHPDIVLVQGDTNSVLAGSIVAAKLHIDVGHVEAGLRSYDRSMPEEINRILSDHCADILFAPTERAQGILLNEGIEADKIFLTGNTIVDAVYQNVKVAEDSIDILKKLDLTKNRYFLVTVHRQENVDCYDKLYSIIKGMQLVHEKFSIPVIFPIHPRTKKQITTFGLNTEGIRLVEPLGFLEFLQLESNARLVMTDSGGAQEETCVLKVPCVTLRNNTERPETVEVGSNILAGVEEEAILSAVTVMINKENVWKNPFGVGQAGRKIVDIVIDKYAQR